MNQEPQPSVREDAARVARRNKITGIVIALVILLLVLASGTSLLTKMH